MRRAILGSIPLIASVAIPATFQGTLYLVVLWLLMGLAGLYLLLSSEPIKRRWIAALQRELAISAPPVAPSANDSKRISDLSAERQLAIAEIEEELEAAHGVLIGPNRARFFVKHELALLKWERYGPVIAATDPAVHSQTSHGDGSVATDY